MFPQRKQTSGQHAHEKMSITSDEGKAQRDTISHRGGWLRLFKREKNTENKHWKGCGETGSPIICWWEREMGQLLGKTVWSFLQKLESRYVTQQFRSWVWTLKDPKQGLEECVHTVSATAGLAGDPSAHRRMGGRARRGPPTRGMPLSRRRGLPALLRRGGVNMLGAISQTWKDKNCVLPPIGGPRRSQRHRNRN